MLLDDVMSELDPERRRSCWSSCCEAGGQALITATEAGHVPDDAERAELAIGDGRVTPPIGATARAA